MAKVLEGESVEALERVGGLNSFFGTWLHDESRLKELKNEYLASSEFNYVVIENFLQNEVALEMARSYPDIGPGKYHKYCNPIEIKFAFDDVKAMSTSASDFFKLANSGDFTATIGEITGIPGLTSDPYLHGAGLHVHPRGGLLLPHLDYSLHPVTGKERRVNIILYLNEHWNEGFNGETTLFDGGIKPLAKIFPKFNRAVLFRTNDISWHGVVPQIVCPSHLVRKTAAIYFVSEPRPNVKHRVKAQFTHEPGRKSSNGLNELLRIRPQRRIVKEDIITHYPNWKSDLAVEPHSVFFSDEEVFKMSM